MCWYGLVSFGCIRFCNSFVWSAITCNLLFWDHWYWQIPCCPTLKAWFYYKLGCECLHGTRCYAIPCQCVWWGNWIWMFQVVFTCRNPNQWWQLSQLWTSTQVSTTVCSVITSLNTGEWFYLSFVLLQPHHPALLILTWNKMEATPIISPMCTASLPNFSERWSIILVEQNGTWHVIHKHFQHKQDTYA